MINIGCLGFNFTIVLCDSELIFIVAYLLSTANWVCRLHSTTPFGANCIFRDTVKLSKKPQKLFLITSLWFLQWIALLYIKVYFIQEGVWRVEKI